MSAIKTLKLCIKDKLSTHDQDPRTSGQAVVKPLINLNDALAERSGPGVPSPCVSICELDEQQGQCKGCYRSLQEIAVWGGLSDAEKRTVWDRIEARQLALAG